MSEIIDEPNAVVENAPEPPTFPPLEEIAAEPSAEKITPLSVILGVVLVPLVAGIVGGLWHLISYHLFDLLFISAIFAGTGAAFLASSVLMRSGTRNRDFVGWCGLIAAVLTMFARYTWDAHATRPAMVEGGVAYISAKQTQLSPEEVRTRVESSLNPWETLKWYMLAQSEEGVSIGRARAVVSTEKPLRLSGFFFWGLIALETGAMVVAGIVAAAIATTNRHCTECGKVLKENLLFRRHSDQSEEVLARARDQDWQGLMALPKAERSDPKNMTDVILHRCEIGGCPATVSVEKQTATEPRKKLLNAWISPQSADAAREASIAEPI